MEENQREKIRTIKGQFQLGNEIGIFDLIKKQRKGEKTNWIFAYFTQNSKLSQLIAIQ